MSELSWVIELMTRLGNILQTALQVHEHFELSQNVYPVRDLCHALELDADAVPLSTVATAVFTLSVFCHEPLVRSHQDFSERVLESLESAEERLLLRQLRAQPAKAVSCIRQGNPRPLMRALSGPSRQREEHVDLVVDLSDGTFLDEGRFMGWTLAVGSRRVFLAGAVLDEAASKALESFSALPMPLDEALFWSEYAKTLWCLAIDPGAVMRLARFVPEEPMFHDGQSIFLSGTQNPQLILERVLLVCDFDGLGSSFSSLPLRRVRNVRAMLAKLRRAEEVAAILELLKAARFSMMGWRSVTLRDGLAGQEIEDILPSKRLLEAFSLRLDGTMVGAERAALVNLPLGLLLLPDEHPIFAHLHPLDTIRSAFDKSALLSASSSAQLSDAFERFFSERRLCASYSVFDLQNPKQLERLDYGAILDALHQVFDPRFFEQRLSALKVSARILGRLETALGAAKGEVNLAHLPATERALLELRNVGSTTTVELRAALLSTADAWRALACGLDPRSLHVAASPVGPSTDSLADGLAALAAFFEPGKD